MKETPPEKLKKAREKVGLSKEAVARKLGVSTRHYYDLEAGLRTPSLFEALALEDLLGLPVRCWRSGMNRKAA